jgi:nitrate/TMAO reductase-like tetraheme cytochrome c subunit
MRDRLARWIGALSLPALAALGVLFVVLAGAGSYYAYRTYDFVEHDNEFCLSCHLMEDPYERFARSAHQDLGCKDCHQPTLIQRSRMGLTQFVENPEELSTHAEVPNELCASCHIEGDPERWSVVAATAGHRVHLESDDPALSGLQCVECHSSSLHEFAASDQTCAQSGCHEDSGIQLGAMSDLTIHCAACHGFNVGVESGPTEVALAALAPNADTCMSCHAMQGLTTVPEDDPHGGTCASCHNPHAQATPREAAETCATAGCHQDPESVTPFHRGLDEGVVSDCLYCHQAHDFRVDGSNCLACHQDVLGQGGASADRSPTPGAPEAVSFAARIPSGGSRFLHAPARPAMAQEQPGFDHEEHRAVPCADCHSSDQEHGALTVTTVTDCRSCHHSAEVAADCSTCHAEPGGAGGVLQVRRTLDLSVGRRPDRALPFDHGVHAGETCATCHAEGPDRSAATADCASCHQPHHEAARDCASCHAPAAPGAHRVETAHLGCGGAGCHQDLPFTSVARTRTVCLVCHQDQRNHRPDGDCAECHAMAGPGFGLARP